MSSIAGALHLALSLFVIRNKFIVNQVRVVCPREYVLWGKPLLQPARYVSFFSFILFVLLHMYVCSHTSKSIIASIEREFPSSESAHKKRDRRKLLFASVYLLSISTCARAQLTYSEKSPVACINEGGCYHSTRSLRSGCGDVKGDPLENILTRPHGKNSSIREPQGGRSEGRRVTALWIWVVSGTYVSRSTSQ